MDDVIIITVPATAKVSGRFAYDRSSQTLFVFDHHRNTWIKNVSDSELQRGAREAQRNMRALRYSNQSGGLLDGRT